jgi:hypothetical protein
VDVHVPETGNEKFSPTIDETRIRRDIGVGRSADVNDPISVNDHRVIGSGRSRDDVDDRNVSDRDRALIAFGTCGEGKGGDRQNGARPR